MTLSLNEHAVVAIFHSSDAAEAGVLALQAAGLDMDPWSVACKEDPSEEPEVQQWTTVDDRVPFWSVLGACWGRLLLGPIVVVGPLVGWIVDSLDGPRGAAGRALGGGLNRIGIPEASVAQYELDVDAGKVMVIARGPTEMVMRAEAILGTTGACQLTVHAA